MKILIFGRQDLELLLLEKPLPKIVDFIHLDVDYNYWEQTTPPFQVKISSTQRNADWAQRYDDENFKGRSKYIHERWMKLLRFAGLKLMGELELKEQVDKILFAMRHSSVTN